jgi:hypothetical protein
VLRQLPLDPLGVVDQVDRRVARRDGERRRADLRERDPERLEPVLRRRV